MHERIALFILDSEIIFYQSTDTIWQKIPLKGEYQLAHEHALHNLQASLEEINNRLNHSNQLADVEICLIYSDDKLSWAKEAFDTLIKQYKGRYLQLIRWQPLTNYLQTLHLKDKELTITDFIEKQILPLVFIEQSLDKVKYLSQQEQTLLDIKSREFAEQHKHQQQMFVDSLNLTKAEFENQVENLNKDKATLLGELYDLKQKVAKLRTPDMTYLVSFLPAIFKEFWSVVSPNDLANLAGLLEAPDIKSPYPILTENAIRAKYQEFLALDTVDREKILNFCHMIKRNYTLRVNYIFKHLLIKENIE